jgi:hypothetical protein
MLLENSLETDRKESLEQVSRAIRYEGVFWQMSTAVKFSSAGSSAYVAMVNKDLF